MKVIKVVNNNVVSAKDNNKEYILMGKGIGYESKVGIDIDLNKVEKKFILDEDENNLIEIISMISPDIVEYTNFAFECAQNELKNMLNQSIFLTLLDHLTFSVQRSQNNIILLSPLDLEVKRVYKKEMKIAKKMRCGLNKKFNLNLPQEEDSMLCLHLVNGNMVEKNMNETFLIVEICDEIVNLIKQLHNISELDTGYYYERFLTHLHYFLKQHLKQSNVTLKDSDLIDELKNKYERTYDTVKIISKFLYDKYDIKVCKEERLYLLLHVQKIISEDLRR